jgi:branched-chain amino acid transport system ATP-binding protein
MGVGRTFQITATFASMTVRENVQMALLSHHRRLSDGWTPLAPLYREEAGRLLERVGMLEQAGRACAVLAYGDLKRVELAVALANEPRLLLMDEPTAGMAAAERVELMALAGAIARERRMAVLFTEHDMDVVFAHADSILVLHRGQVIAQGKPAEVRASAEVREVYLGSQVLNLNTYYGRAHILADVALEVAGGEVVVLLGRNGAGKSTTLKSIMGWTQPRSGEIVFDGRRIDRLPTWRIARSGLGYVPEDRRIFTDLSVMENLDIGKRGQGWTRERLFTLFPNLAEAQSRPAGKISGGEQQMLAIARTLMGNPSCVLLDEPSEGLAPLIVDQMAAALRGLKAAGVAVLLCEQSWRFAAAVADRAYVIETGRIRFAGTIAELAADESARTRYLAV